MIIKQIFGQNRLIRNLNLVATYSLNSIPQKINQIFRIKFILKISSRYIETLKAYYRSEINAHYHSFVSYYIHGETNIGDRFSVCITAVITYKGSCYWYPTSQFLTRKF